MASDVDQIADLLEARGEPSDAVDLRLMVDDIGLDGVAVVVDGTRVVSTASLLDETLPCGIPVAISSWRPVRSSWWPRTRRRGPGTRPSPDGWAHERSAEPATTSR